MKNLLLASAAVLGLTVAHGQTNVYHPFPKDSAVWFYITSNPYGSHYDFTQWLGDTIINSISYKKATHKHDSLPWTYTGGIRQDIPNEKIYAIDLNGVEIDISVNQHLVVGDTFSTSYFDTLIITNIDSVLIGTKYHKQYHYGSYLDSGAYIVGVAEVWRYSFEAGSNLSCFSINNINLYGSAPFCILAATNELVSNNNKVSIFPNPFSTLTTLQTTVPLHNATLTVYNSFGQTVKQFVPDKVGTDSFVISRDNLPSGLYFLRIAYPSPVLGEGGGEVIHTEKLVITDN